MRAKTNVITSTILPYRQVANERFDSQKQKTADRKGRDPKSISMQETDEDIKICQALKAIGVEAYRENHGKIVEVAETTGDKKHIPQYQNLSLIPAIAKRKQKGIRNKLLAFAHDKRFASPVDRFRMLTISPFDSRCRIWEVQDRVKVLQQMISRLTRRVIKNQFQTLLAQVEIEVSGEGSIENLTFHVHAHIIALFPAPITPSIEKAAKTSLHKHFKSPADGAIHTGRPIDSFTELEKAVNYCPKPEAVTNHIIDNCPKALATWHKVRTNRKPGKTYANAPASDRYFATYGNFRAFCAMLKKERIGILINRTDSQPPQIQLYYKAAFDANPPEPTPPEDEDDELPEAKNVLLSRPSPPRLVNGVMTITRRFFNLTNQHEAYRKNRILPFIPDAWLVDVRVCYTLKRRIQNIHELEDFDEKWDLIASTGWFPWMRPVYSTHSHAEAA